MTVCPEALTTGLLRGAKGFWRRARHYIVYREEDGVLILPPNRVMKLNESGARVLGLLDGGVDLDRIPSLEGESRAQVAEFIACLEAAYKGEESAQETVPYDFNFTRLPILAEIALSYDCNAACKFCYASCGPGKCGSRPGGSGLSTKDAKRVIDIFKDEAKVPFFSFTGGEPLLRKDLEELARHARGRGLRINLITNGTLVDGARARSLARAGFDTAQVSLESPDPAVHDGLTSLPGSHGRTVAGIAAMRAIGISVQTNSTVTALNRESLLDMPAYLAGLGVKRFSMNLFIPSGRGRGDDELFVSYASIGVFVDAIAKAARAAGLTFFWYSPTPFCMYNPIARGLGNKSCAAVDGLLSVNPRGEILPCSSWDEGIGNILERPFKELWLSDRAAWFKRKRFAPRACAECSSFTACQGACPLYWASRGYGELETTIGKRIEEEPHGRGF